MKKILFLMLMFMGLLSSLYALETTKIGCGIEKSHTLDIINDATSVPSDMIVGQVYIHHKDTLMYSLDLGMDSKLIKQTSRCDQNANIQLAYATVAVVCYPRGEGGV